MIPRETDAPRPGEPTFTLRASDPLAGFLVSIWSSACLADGEAASAKFNAMFERAVPALAVDYEDAQDALDTSLAMFAWREKGGGTAIIRESTKPAVDLERALRAAILALRSYEYGNAAIDLARSTADAGDEALRAAGLRPATLGAPR